MGEISLLVKFTTTLDCELLLFKLQNLTENPQNIKKEYPTLQLDIPTLQLDIPKKLFKWLNKLLRLLL